MLKGKHILLGVTGSIAAYKALEIISLLKKQGAEIKVIMTESATKFVTPLSFSSLTNNPAAVNMFDEPIKWDIEHISLAKWADVAVVAPASANIIGKIAHGIADDMLSTVIMATKAPILIAPAMNTAMYENVAVQENIKLLKERGISFVEPSSGVLACGDSGRGKLENPETIIEEIINTVTIKKDLQGLKILVTAGATIEKIDPVRFITNHSTGKMGIAIAKAAHYRGADVTLVHGAISVPKPYNIKCIEAESASKMYEACSKLFSENDVLIKSAAVADFRPINYEENKMKKKERLSLELSKNIDILAELSASKRDNQTVVGFCMETKDLLENATSKLKSKKLDMIVANNLFDENAGFASDNNTVTIIEKNGHIDKLPNMDKFSVANKLLDKLLSVRSGK
ncbi:MAG: bifunctional phosphopantothenoylcysteine decarboxylase/phosphopantothenate--cysteine ligase CoaBC [Clostridia bacterium]|nr:bifunctional phosphopantothenoylcysteine decarboxylase/phosphopantothenate--cysteine ligase CoaBC [Clostridia bacterium]